MNLSGELAGFAGHLASRGSSSNTQKAYLSDLRDLLGFLHDKKRELDLDALDYWDFNWRKKGGSSRMLEISKKESFYQQEYCGCVYSLRDTNNWRLSRGRERVQRGVKFYQEALQSLDLENLS